MEYIIALGAFQALIALSLFIGNSQRKPADNLLHWLLICIFSHLAIKFVIFAISGNLVLQHAFNTFIGLAYGPLLLMYTNKVLNDRYRPLQHWYLLLPMVAAAAIYFTITIKIIHQPASAMRLLAFYNTITQYLILSSCIIFPVICLMLCHRIPAFWKSEKRLIRRIALCYLIVPAVWMAGNIIQFFSWLQPGQLNINNRVIAYCNAVLIGFIIIRYRLAGHEMDQPVAEEPVLPALPDLHEPAVLIQEQENLSVTAEPAHRRSVLAEDQQASIANRLSQLMQEKKVYTDAELTLEKLASLMKTPRHHISEVLNQYLHKSFYQFINEYRMQEVLLLLD